ncbi:uncharacterized protein LOC123448906 [Hordeum vulgare subsp. vulgare]|uniref:uncharacterized protein LOC123448906 n=1 Tax=Hordeum vulgare subsp. vulgare TaxID=112509 RepID=UPI001D1A47D3|nr:uncharacterized protein LOC123448906 [Hordeum vulgare subsp. vulgare]
MSSASSSAITRRLSTPTPPKSTICSRGGPICSIGSLILALRRPINNKGARVRLWRSVRHPSGPYVSIPPSQGAVASPISVPACVRCLTGLWTMATPLSIGSRCCPHPPVPLPDTGENTKLWKTLCEQYFAMFGIHPSFWVPMASLNFTGAAAIWLQSLHNCLAEFDWEAFTTLLCTRFGRDRHRFLI